MAHIIHNELQMQLADKTEKNSYSVTKRYKENLNSLGVNFCKVTSHPNEVSLDVVALMEDLA